MSIELKQTLKLTQQLIMTPQLQQAIKLLQLNHMELQDAITQELLENPILEESTDEKTEEEIPTNLNDPQDNLNPGSESFNWESYIQEYNSNELPTTSQRKLEDELPNFENALVRTESLEEHLFWQLSMSSLSNEQQELGQRIIGNLSEEGYLNVSLESLAEQSHLNISQAEQTLKTIQLFDPVGIAARNLQECLLVQAELLDPQQPLVKTLIQDYLPELEKKAYLQICKKLSLPQEKVLEAIRVISDFEPHPAEPFSNLETQYITPDIYVVKKGKTFEILVNDEGLPRLRIASYYKNLLTHPNPDQKNNKLTKEYIAEKLKSAVWLIRSIHNRQKTIYRVTEAIIKRQHDFFEYGASYLKPMILRDVAEDIDMHESTISRVTTNKFMHTPLGIFELKYFFNSSLHSSDGNENIASETVKQKIKKLISEEDHTKPYSDDKIAQILKTQNIDIARRTVAKYREALGILPSSKRKKFL